MLKMRSNDRDGIASTKQLLEVIWDHAMNLIAEGSCGKTVAGIFHNALNHTMKLPGKDARFLNIDADVTNPKALSDAFAGTEGPLCIIASGVFMYLTDTEAGVFLDTIRSVLTEKGGCLITPDPESAVFFMALWEVVCADGFIDVFMRTNETRPWEEEDCINNTLIIDPRWDRSRLTKRVQDFLKGHDLKAERIEACSYIPDMTGTFDADCATSDELKKALKNLAYYKITPAGEQNTTARNLKGDKYEFKAEADSDTLRIRLAGRVDSVSAPALMDIYSAFGNGIRFVVLDCRDLDFISSLGLRVLLKIAKDCEVTLCRINELVGEILSQTGFDSIVNIHK